MIRMLSVALVAAALTSCVSAEKKDPVPPTRADVIAFVNSAAEYMRAVGKDNALAEFNKRDGTFFRGELYIYAYDMKGVCLAHPLIPSRVGKDTSNDRDVHGISIHQECLRVFSRADTGWIRCTWLNPLTQTMEPKALFVMKVAPDLYIGSGTYGPAAQKIADAPPTRAEVVAFVDSAVDYVRAVGKDKALAEFNNRSGAFVRGSLYIYAYDMKGICLAHGLFPNRAGRDCSKDKDSHGIAMQEECLKLLAVSDTAWMKCMWANPETKQLEPKLLYMVKIPPDWYLGSGTYGSEAAK